MTTFSVSLNRTLSKPGRLALEEALLGALLPDHFAFEKGELRFSHLQDVENALPIIRDLVDAIWNAQGKNLTDRFLSVFDTY